MSNPFRDGYTVKNDVPRYKITLKRMPAELKGDALDIGVVNPFTLLLARRYPILRIVNTNQNVDLDTDAIAFTDNSFDVIFHFEVLEHLMNQLHNMMECKRVLRPGGRMFLTTPVGVFPSSMWAKTHFNELNRGNLEMLLKRAGFTITRFERFNKSLLYYWRMGIFRPTLRALFGGWYYVECVN